MGCCDKSLYTCTLTWCYVVDLRSHMCLVREVCYFVFLGWGSNVHVNLSNWSYARDDEKKFPKMPAGARLRDDRALLVDVFVRGLLTYPWCIWGYHYAWHGNPILNQAGFHGLTCWVLNTAHIVPQFDSWEMNIGKVVGTFGGTFKDLQLIGHVACLRPSTLNGWPLYS